MADCFSLPNAAEFVKELRTNGNYIDCFECKYECWQCNDGAKDCMIDVAADAIEQLAQENERLKAERDAAVEDLARTSSCLSCVHCNLNDLTCDCLDECALGTESKWEWRGVKEKEDAEE